LRFEVLAPDGTSIFGAIEHRYVPLAKGRA
jgi:hypothetical protein